MLDNVTSHTPNGASEFRPDTVSLARMERARLLVEAGFADWAETELRFGARHGGQAYVLAAELARMATRRNAPAQGLRYIKAVARGYLTLSPEDAPDSFWRMAFPLPYRALVERNASANRLDPHVVAGLIRQESEFDPQAVSRSGACGLDASDARDGETIGPPTRHQTFSHRHFVPARYQLAVRHSLFALHSGSIRRPLGARASRVQRRRFALQGLAQLGRIPRAGRVRRDHPFFRDAQLRADRTSQRRNLPRALCQQHLGAATAAIHEKGPRPPPVLNQGQYPQFPISSASPPRRRRHRRGPRKRRASAAGSRVRARQCPNELNSIAS